MKIANIFPKKKKRKERKRRDEMQKSLSKSQGILLPRPIKKESFTETGREESWGFK